MKDLLIHTATGRHVDLGAPVDGETFAWLESLQGAKGRPLECGACHSTLYIRHDPGRSDRLHGVHHQAAGCRNFTISRTAPMTDEHKNAAEYHMLTLDGQGIPADMEVRTSGNTIVDVVADGRFGFEIQHSGLLLPAARDRTKRSMAAGLEIVSWSTDRPVMPVWYGRLPSYTTTVRSWKEMPRLGTVTAIGPQIAEAVLCSYVAFGKCPDGKRRPCGKYHVKYRPWPMLLDDVVARIAAREMVAAQTGKYVRLVSPRSLRLYEELTGLSGSYGPQAAPRNEPVPDRRIECIRLIRAGGFPRPEDLKQLELNYAAAARPPMTFGKRPSGCDVPACASHVARLFPCGWRCDDHKPVRRSLSG